MSAHFALPWLRPSGRIQIVAPSGPFDVQELERGVTALRARYEVRYDPDMLQRTGYFAGSDARRAAELRAAIEDDSVDAIVAARGGYGATRLLSQLDPALVARHPKLLVGFSDVTALHALWTRAGVGSIHAPVVAGLGRANPAQVERWQRAVEGVLPATLHDLSVIAPGCARGPLLGGNLTVLTALMGTPFFPTLDGCVLFLEDIGERPYRVDRMLTTWHQAGVLDRVSGIALGAFVDATPGPDGVRVEQVLQERLAGLGIPVLSGVPSGHVEDNLELPLGANVALDADQGTLSFEGDVA